MRSKKHKYKGLGWSRSGSRSWSRSLGWSGSL